MNKVYSVLVIYNPHINELALAIERLKCQTDIVIVCNNSDYDVSIDDDHVEVFNFRENLGIAKAQSIGMKWAFSNGADFILQMDQDSSPDEFLVKNLLYCYDSLTRNGYKIGLVGPQDFDKDTKVLNDARLLKGEPIGEEGFVSVMQTLSSGSLVPKEIYDVVGGMDDALFIDAVDSEYCWRIKKNGFLIIKNNRALLGHKLGCGQKKILGFISVGVSIPLRNYYQTRNTLILFSRRYVPLYWKCSGLAKIIFKLTIYPFVLDNGFVRFKYIVLGLKDGLLGRCGKISE